MIELVTTDLLSPNIYALVMMGTLRYLSVFLRSVICSVAVLAATNSEPYVAVTTMACLFKNQSVGVVLTKCNTAVTNFPVTILWSTLTSKNLVVITLFPNGYILWDLLFDISKDSPGPFILLFWSVRIIRFFGSVPMPFYSF